MPEQASGGPSHSTDQDPNQSTPESRQHAAAAGDPPDTGHGVLTAGSESSGLDHEQTSDHREPGQGDGPQSQDRDHYDPRYLSWREQQLRVLDAEYDAFQRERQDRFVAAEFDSWRQARRRQESAGPESSSQGDMPEGS